MLKPVTLVDDMGDTGIVQDPAEYDRLRAEVAEAEVARLLALLDKAAPWACPTCGPHTKVDEDGCCAYCGEDAVRSLGACVIGEPCAIHDGVVHGGEAEELRQRLERWRDEPWTNMREQRRINKILDDVDARDSLAYIEARATEQTTA